MRNCPSLQKNNSKHNTAPDVTPKRTSCKKMIKARQGCFFPSPEGSVRCKSGRGLFKSASTARPGYLTPRKTRLTRMIS